MTEAEIIQLIKDDAWMMKVLRIAADLDLPDWMIGAGFVRNKVWDYLHGFVHEEVPTADIDLIYYDATNLDENSEKEYDKLLREKLDINWSTKNQARMGKAYGRSEQFKSSEEGLSEWPETATAVAVKLMSDGELRLIAPHGIDDLVNLIVRPTPAKANDLELFQGRINGKKWLEKWPRLRVEA